MKIIILLILFTSAIAEIVFPQWIVEETKIKSIFNSIIFSSTTNAVIVGTNGVILHTSDAGTNWNIVSSNLSTNLEEVYFLDSENGWIVGDSGVVLRTSNGGMNWILLNNTITERLYSVYFINNSTGWIAGKNVIYKTTNGGSDWTQKYFNNIQSFFAIYFTDSLNGWTSDDYILLRTTDGGDNWMIQDSTIYGFLNSINFPTDSVGYIAGDNSLVLKTTDKGNSWEELITMHPGDYDWLGAYFIDKNRGWLCGFMGVIISTTDGGRNWKIQRPPVGNIEALKSICFIDSMTGWTVGATLGLGDSYYGTILRTTNGGITYSEDNGEKLTENYSLMQNYPNPFNPGTLIIFEIKNTGLVTLKVYDILGKEVKTLIEEIKTPGYYSINFIANNLSSGIYFYTLKTKNYTQTNKMLLLK